MATFDVLGAKKAGYTDAEIAQYLSSESQFDFQGAVNAGYKPEEIVKHLNATGATPFETFKQSAKQEVGSEIKGIRQILGTEPTDTAEESLRRQMESENPIAGVLGTLAGGLVNPSTLLPGAMFGKGAKALIAGGAAAGGVSGALQPRYEENDFSRIASTGIGAVGGAALVGALVGGQKGLVKVWNKLTKEISDIPANKLDPEVDVPIGASDQVVQEMATPKMQDNVSPWIQSIEDAEIKAKANEQLANGDYSSFFTGSAFRLSDTPDFRYKEAFSVDNPFRDKNIEAVAQASAKSADDTEDVLKELVASWSPQLREELGLTAKFKDYTPEQAAEFFRLRGLEEVAPAEIQRAFQPIADNAFKTLGNISELWKVGRSEGLSDTELTQMFAGEMEAIKPFLTSPFGSARNAGKALNEWKNLRKKLGNLSPKDIRNYLSTQEGKSEADALVNLMDAFKTIDDAPGSSFDKQIMKRELVGKTFKDPNWKDKFGEYVVNSYISGLATPVVNAASGIAKAGLLSAERLISGLNPFSAVKLGEVLPSFQGMMQGLMEGVYFAKEGFVRGTPLDATIPELYGAIGKQKGATQLEKKVGEVVRIPGRVSIGIDEFFKSMFRRMEYNAQSYRIAQSGKYGDARDVYDTLRKINTKDVDWKEKLIDSPGLAQLPNNIRKKLVDDVTKYSKYATFQQDLTGFAKTVSQARANHPELAWVFPFVKTPLNIMADAISYTPLNVFQKNLPNDVKIARTAMGVAMVAGISQAVGDGKITGSYSKEADKRNAMIAAGIPEYSIKLGDTWYSYARVEPIATVMGSAVDGINTINEYFKKNPNDRKGSELVTNVVAGITKNIASKTFLEGISGVMQAIHDPERYGGSFVNSFSGLVVPSFVAAPARSLDPNMRIVTNFGEAVQNRLPNLGQEFARENLPAQTMLFGGARPNPSFGAAAFTGLQTAPVAQTPLQQEVSRIKFDYNLPSKKLKGVELTGEEQARYQELSSQYADSILPRVIENAGYQNARDSVKKVILEKAMAKARKAATNVMTGEKLRDPEFRKEVVRLKLSKKGIEEE
jgi:hypothetical protein